MDPAAFCDQARVLIVAGKGGVGKTTVSAALASLAARLGRRVLIVEVEGRQGLPTLFGRPEQLAYQELLLAGGPGRGEVRARTLTPDDALVEYLEDHGMRRVSRRLVASGALDVVSTAVPGIRDLLVLAKIKQIERAAAAGQAGSYDLIVVDAPASGHAVTFLTSARGLADLASAGPLRSQAAEVTAMLTDPTRCHVLLVTTPEETPVSETIETAFVVEDQAGVSLAPVVVNGCWPVLDLPEDPAAAAAALSEGATPERPDGGATGREEREDARGARDGRQDSGPIRDGRQDAAAIREVLAEAAAFRRARQQRQAVQVERLAKELPLAQLALPFRFTTNLGPADLDALVDDLARSIDGLPA